MQRKGGNSDWQKVTLCLLSGLPKVKCFYEECLFLRLRNTFGIGTVIDSNSAKKKLLIPF